MYLSIFLTQYLKFIDSSIQPPLVQYYVINKKGFRKVLPARLLSNKPIFLQGTKHVILKDPPLKKMTRLIDNGTMSTMRKI